MRVGDIVKHSHPVFGVVSRIVSSREVEIRYIHVLAKPHRRGEPNVYALPETENRVYHTVTLDKHRLEILEAV